MNKYGDSSWQKKAVIVLLILAVLRLVAMWTIPLTDNTEARYAEIARKMLETNNWVTLWHDYGVPFWGKPPLSSWLSAISLAVFGVNQWAVRFPSFLLSLITLGLVAFCIGRRHGKAAIYVCVLVLSSSVLFLLTEGTVMTDPALLFAVTLAHVAFWQAWTTQKRCWGYLFFIALGLGLLAKGPLTLVLVGFVVLVWITLHHQWSVLWHRLPWVGGSCIMLLIALPWYGLAEYRTPGFLDYFLVGEHIKRFLDVGWHGDKYGFAHATPKGMIWLYTWLGLLPWSLVMLLWLPRLYRHRKALLVDHDGWLRYLALWVMITPLFFTFSGNIIFPYPLPMTPAFALLFAELWSRWRCIKCSLSDVKESYLPWIAGLSVLLLIGVLLFNGYAGKTYLRTQKGVIDAWKSHTFPGKSMLVYWDDRREFSAEFYSAGQVKTTDNPMQLRQWLKQAKYPFIVTNPKMLKRLPEDIRHNLHRVAIFNWRNGDQWFLAQVGQAVIATPAMGIPP